MTILNTKLLPSFYDQREPSPLTIVGSLRNSSNNKKLVTKLVMVVGLEVQQSILKIFILQHYYLLSFICICQILVIILAKPAYKMVMKERIYNSLPVYMAGEYNNTFTKKSDDNIFYYQYSYNGEGQCQHSKLQNGLPQEDMKASSYSPTLRRRSFKGNTEIKKLADIALTVDSGNSNQRLLLRRRIIFNAITKFNSMMDIAAKRQSSSRRNTFDGNNSFHIAAKRAADC